MPHAAFKRRLAELMVANQRDRKQFLGALESFLAVVNSQREADERQIVPALQRALDVDARRVVFNDIDRLYSLTRANEDGIVVAEEASKPGIGLLQEAHLVLRSLGAGPEATDGEGPSSP